MFSPTARICGKDERTWYRIASRERVTRQSGRAAADRIVVDDLTSGLLSARSRTRVATFVVQARLGQRTFGTHDAFVFAVRGSSDQPGLAGADGVAVDNSANTVRSAGRRATRISLNGCNDKSPQQSAVAEN